MSSEIVQRSAWFDTTCVSRNLFPVTGDLTDLSNHSSMALRSYECPSAATTGSIMGMYVMGQ